MSEEFGNNVTMKEIEKNLHGLKHIKHRRPRQAVLERSIAVAREYAGNNGLTVQQVARKYGYSSTQSVYNCINRVNEMLEEK